MATNGATSGLCRKDSLKTELPKRDQIQTLAKLYESLTARSVVRSMESPRNAGSDRSG